MKYVYLGMLVLILIPLLICIYFVHSIEEGALKKAVMGLLSSVTATVMVYGMAVMTVNKTLALFFYGLFYIGIACMVMAYARYVHITINLKHGVKLIHLFMLLSLVADSVCMVANVFSEKVFQVQDFQDNYGNVYFDVVNRTAWYNLHLDICYLFVGLSFVMLIYCQIRAPKIFRARYRAILVLMIIAVVVNALYLQFGGMLDYSMLAYALLAVAITHLSFYYIPNGLIEKMLALFIKSIDDGIVCFDLKGKCIFVNERIRAMYKVKEDSDLSEFEKTYYLWLQEKMMQETEEIEWEEQPVVNGKTRYYHLEYKKIIYDNRLIGSFFLVHDRTEEVERVEQELYKLNHDALTGVYKRQYFYKKAEQLLKRKAGQPYYILCTDIRDFKIVNDIYGDEKGDEILVKIADSLRQRADEDCVYGRLSGDRFAFLMPKEKFRENEIRKEISRVERLEGNSNFRVRINLGIYEVDNTDTPISVMCDRAIMAIMSIKDDIGSRIAYYDEALRNNTLREQAIVGQFHEALAGGQFCFYLQPQISVDGVVRGGEALVRWIHPEKGLIPPGQFVELFERTGLISELDYYIWEKACIQLRDWRKQGHVDYYISVNISPRDFYHMDIYKVFTELIQKHGIEARNLRLEITETAVMTDMRKVVGLVNKLRKYGFIVEMDDFGSGYSSLNMLKDIHMDTIKLDMGFLRKTMHTERSMSIIRSVIKLSKQLGMEVVTEGVETKEQVDALTEMGCDLFQGYYFAKPMSVWDYEDAYVPVNKGV